MTGRNFAVGLDRTALDLDWIVVNGGRRGLSGRLTVADLIALTQARFVEAAADPAGR